MKVHKIPDEIYYTNIFVLIDATKTSLERYFKKHYGHSYTHDNFCNAFHYVLASEVEGVKYHFLIFEKFDNTPSGLGTFNHELLHLVFSVLDGVGMIYTPESEEAYTYYLNYLTERVLDKLC